MPKLRQHADAMGHAESSFVRRILSRRVDLMRCGGHNGRMERSRRYVTDVTVVTSGSGSESSKPKPYRSGWAMGALGRCRERRIGA